MKQVIAIVLVVACCGCAKKPGYPAAPAATAHGAAIVLSSGEKQTASTGAVLDQPVVVQVNDAQGNAVTGAPVWMQGRSDVRFDPSSGITDSSGQFTTNIALGGMAGLYQITAYSTDSSGKRVDIKFAEIALGYQQGLGAQLNDRYCVRCHSNESTPERVSNYDNLNTKPHPFTEGDTLNKLTDDDLAAIITHGGGALNKSPEMPPFGFTLSKSDVQALVAYIRAVADPPYRASGLVYAKN
jgi:mono/diheme cytochrome c family protein